MNYDKLTKEEIIKILDDTLGYIDKQEKEIERLNNIINELERWLNEEKEATFYDYQFAIEDVLDKLRELKGSDKNES